MSRIVCLLAGLLFGCSTQNWRPVGVKPEKPNFFPVWIKNLDPVHQTGNLPVALRGPLIHQNVLYAGDDSGYMNAYRLKDGFPLWKKYDGGSYHSAPVPFKNAIIYGNTQGRVFARDKKTGKALYRVDLGSSVEGPGTIHKGRACFHLRNHKIFCLDAASGKILWAYKRSVPRNTTVQRVSRPVAREGRIYTGFADGSAAALSLEEGIVQWEKKLSTGIKFIDVDSTPTFFQGKLVIGPSDGSASVLHPKDGRILRRLSHTITRAPLNYRGNLLLATVEGELVQLNDSWQEIRKLKISDDPLGSIVPWKNWIAVATIGRKIYLVDPDKNIVLDSFDLGHNISAVFGSLSASDGHLAALSSRNRLYVFH